MKQTPGKIYLADQRGLTETNQFRRYCTFNYGNYINKHKAPAGDLYTFNEESFAGGYQEQVKVAQATYIIIVPITGAVTFTDPEGQINTVDVEQILVYMLPAHSTYSLSNSYEKETITFLQIQILAKEPILNLTSQIYCFNQAQITNQLAPIVPAVIKNPDVIQLPFILSMGLFDGRQEALYKLTSPEALFFGFVIAGAFELEGRLMHEKDSLALWDTEEVEVEALSNNALILTIELKA